MDSNNEINAIVEQLKADSITSDKSITVSNNEVPLPDVNDENINEYVIRKTTENIEASLDAVNSLKDIVITGQNPMEISALASLINATTKAIDSLNKLNIQNKNIKNSIQLKEMEVSAAKSIKPPTTNVLIATREEIMSKIYDKPKREKVELITDVEEEI